MDGELQRGAKTPLGRIVEVQTIDRGIYWVTTVEHAGYMIDQALAQEKLTAAARAIGVPYNEKWLCFEEDCAWAVVVSERPEWATQPLQSETVQGILQREYPDYLQAKGEQPAN